MHHPKKKKSSSSVSLVQNLKLYENAFVHAKKEPAIDLKKVNQVRDAIQQGKYHIDYSKLIERLLEDI